MIPRLTRMTATLTLLSALAAFAWAAQKQEPSYEKSGCCADACAKEVGDSCCDASADDVGDGEETSPACADPCGCAVDDPKEKPASPACPTSCSKKDACGNCCEKGDSDCCSKTDSCGTCCKKANACSKTDSCGTCCKKANACSKTDSCGTCCKKANACKKADSCTGCCKAIAAKMAKACGACCKVAAAASEACCACCKGECPCSKKEATGCCASGKGCCAAVAHACCACCKAAAAVSVAEACCACCKGECSCSKKEATGCCASGKGCCAAAPKACCACCKAAAAVSVAEACCACCKGECPCSKKASGAVKKADCCPKETKPEEAKPPVAPVFTPLIVVPQVPGSPNMPYFSAPMMPHGLCAPPAFDHTTMNTPMAYPGAAYGCAMPQPVAVAFTTASPAKEYEVCVKLIDCKAGQSDKVITLPKITVAEGQPGTCTIGTQANVGRMRVRVDRADAGKVALGIRLSRHNVCNEADGSVALCQSCTAVRTLKLNDTTRLALGKNCEETTCGKSGKWAEIVVKECGTSSAAMMPSINPPYCGPMPYGPPVCSQMPAYGPMPMPVTTVQPAPPICSTCPPMPVVSSCNTEIVRCSATTGAKCDRAARVVSVASDGCLQLRDSDCTVRGTSVTLSVKGTTLTLRSDDVKGRKRVCVEADCDLEAVADTMTVEADGRLVLEGEVKILCASPSSGMAERVEAGCVILELDSGKMKCLEVVHEKP